VPSDAEAAEKPPVNQFLAESRSAFMARFTSTIGRSPMLVLRDLRMQQTASRLAATELTIDQVAGNAGYASRSSFARAFKTAYGVDPTDYRNRRDPARS
jgi:AraC family transcriptional activator of mtrCDE